MKKTNPYLLLFLAILFVLGIFVVGYLWLDKPANIKIVGVSTVQCDTGLLFVEVDGIKYAPDYIYTGMSNIRTGKEMMPPVEGMKVTCFTMHGNPNIEFIAGEHSQEYLEKYFHSNDFFPIVIIFVLFLGMIIFAIPTKEKKV